MDIVAVAQQAIALFQHHQPWLAEKLGAAALTQAVKELWDRTKAKLGGAAQEVEQKPQDPTEWELLRSQFLLALKSDKDFAEQVAQLLKKAGASESAGISQTAQGTGINQAGVAGSQGVTISQNQK